MEALAHLQKEHLQIRQMVRALEAVAARARESGRLPGRRTLELLGYFDAFADGWHQDKEEQHLFPRLRRRGTASEDRRVRSLLHDHFEERRRMTSMRSHVVSAAFGEPLSLRAFIRDAEAFARLHRRHMQQEDNVVYPLASKLLTAQDDSDIAAGFVEIDQEYSVTSETYGRIESLCRDLLELSSAENSHPEASAPKEVS